MSDLFFKWAQITTKTNIKVKDHVIWDDQEWSQHASRLSEVCLDFKLVGQHHFKDEVVLVADQVWYEFTEADQVALAVEILP